MGAVILYFLIGVAIGTITFVLMATIRRVKELQKLINNLATISENAVVKLGQHDRKITDLLLLIGETAQTLSKVADKIDMNDQEFVDQQIMIDMHDKVFIDHRKIIDKHDQTFIDQQIMIDDLNQKIIKLGKGD